MEKQRNMNDYDSKIESSESVHMRENSPLWRIYHSCSNFLFIFLVGREMENTTVKILITNLIIRKSAGPYPSS